MTLILNIHSLFIILFSSYVFCSPLNYEVEQNTNEDSDSSDSESSEKDEATLPPEEMEELKEKIIKYQEEESEKFGLPLTSSPEKIQKFLENEERKHGKELPELVDESVTDSGNLDSLVKLIALFDKIESETPENEEEIKEKSPEEMQKMKEELYEIINKDSDKLGIPELSKEEYDNVWNERKEELGKKFPGTVEKVILSLKTLEKIEDEVDEDKPFPESSSLNPEPSTNEPEPTEEEAPEDVFALRNAENKICILAKFHSAITVTYAGKSPEQTVHMSVPSNAHVKGECAGPDNPPKLKLTWETFSFNFLFEKDEENWYCSEIHFSYDTSEPLFDGATNPRKVLVKSKKKNLFETPLGKSYYCPAKEMIPLFREDEQVAHVDLKDIRMQPYDVKDGKFSASHRCDKVVIGVLEEVFVQDETVPLAVGLTLALITLLVLVGFSVHRAILAARQDYNTMKP